MKESFVKILFIFNFLLCIVEGFEIDIKRYKCRDDTPIQIHGQPNITCNGASECQPGDRFTVYANRKYRIFYLLVYVYYHYLHSIYFLIPSQNITVTITQDMGDAVYIHSSVWLKKIIPILKLYGNENRRLDMCKPRNKNLFTPLTSSEYGGDDSSSSYSCPDEGNYIVHTSGKIPSSSTLNTFFMSAIGFIPVTLSGELHDADNERLLARCEGTVHFKNTTFEESAIKYSTYFGGFALVGYLVEKRRKKRRVITKGDEDDSGASYADAFHRMSDFNGGAKDSAFV